MPRRIQIDGVIHEVPDDATDAEIEQMFAPAEDVWDRKQSELFGYPIKKPEHLPPVSSALPMIGATVATGGLGAGGGLLRTGARLLTSALGAGAGEGARQAVEGEDINLPAMVAQGGVQGAAPQAVGEAGGLLRRGATRLMQSALKPTQALANARKGAGYGTKEKIAQAVLDEKRNVTRGGLDKAQAALEATDTAAHGQLRAGVGRGVQVDPFKVTQAIDDTANTGTFGKQINAQPDTAAIRQVHENFATNPHISDPVGGLAPIDPVMAHEFASNTGRNLKGKFGRLGGATVEAEKAGREAITSQLRGKIPELQHLWDAEARQITVRDALEDAVARTGNRDPIGLGGVIGMIHSPGLALTAMADRSAPIKSMAARGMNAMGGKTDPAKIRAALLALMTSHGQQ
jgi:hypothetical protein